MRVLAWHVGDFAACGPGPARRTVRQTALIREAKRGAEDAENGDGLQANDNNERQDAENGSSNGTSRTWSGLNTRDVHDLTAI